MTYLYWLALVPLTLIAALVVFIVLVLVQNVWGWKKVLFCAATSAITLVALELFSWGLTNLSQ